MRQITLDISLLKDMLRDAAELGCANYIRSTQPSSDVVSQREAHRLYGKTRVESWLRDGQVGAMKSGAAENSKILYSRAELMAADKNERMLYQVGLRAY